MENENQNVLDFLDSTTNDNSTNTGNSTPPINNQKKFNFKGNKVFYIVIGIVIIMLILASLIFYKSLQSNVKNTTNSQKEQIKPKMEILDYKIDVDVNNDSIFTVNIVLTVDYINSGGITYIVPKPYGSPVIYDVKMSSNNNMETFEKEDDENYYFKFGNSGQTFTDKVIHKISYKYPEQIAYDDTKFTFINETLGKSIPKFQLSITVPPYMLENYTDLKFNREMNCTTNYNTTTCKVENLEEYSKIDVTFMQKKQEQVESLVPNNGYEKYLLPASVLSNNDLNEFDVGDYININSNGINGHDELTGEFIKNVRILEFKDSSNNSINSNNLENLAYVVIEADSQISYLLSNVPYVSNYLNLNIEKSNNNDLPKVIQNDITLFIDSASF